MTRSFVTYILSVRSTLRAARPGLTSSGDAPGTAAAAEAAPVSRRDSNDEEHDLAPIIEAEEASPDDARKESPPEDVETPVFL